LGRAAVSAIVLGMRTRLIGSLAVALLAFGVAAARAQAQAPKPADKPAEKKAAPAPPPAAPGAPAAPRPPAELDQLKYFEGTWRCEGKAPAGPMGPEHGYKSTFKVKKDLDGFWYAVEYEQKKSKENPLAIRAKGFFSYDTGGKKYLFGGFDNVGGMMNETSTGFEGDKMIAAGDGIAMGQKTSFRETYTKKSDREMTWLGELKMGKDWMVVGTDTCKK
jgi:Protein of unknown function (DUF1579)